MKSCFRNYLFLLLLSASVFLRESVALEIEIAEHWETFKEYFNKTYDSADEEAKRAEVFENNVALISKHNLENDVQMNNFRLGINKYTDLTTEEFNNLFHSLETEANLTECAHEERECPCNIPLPDSVDYRNVRMVTYVKDQGPCTSSYAIAAAGALEAQWKKKTGDLASLSTQEILECSKEEGNKGCEGGAVTQVFEYVMRNGGVDRETPYPFRKKDHICSDVNKGYRTVCHGYKVVPCGNEAALQKTVAFVGPVAVTVDAHLPEFHMYHDGIFDAPNCNGKLNHAMLLIGYGTEDGKDYWLLKNSYGKSWGDDGYMKMARNNNNQCGIASMASYPLV